MKHLRAITKFLACAGALFLACMTSHADPPATLTAGGQVSGALPSATQQVYSTTNSSLVVNGPVGTAASNVWNCDIGSQLDTRNSVGTEEICVLSQETNSGTIGHMGYYAVMNHTLTGDDPAVFAAMTFRPIPTPGITLGSATYLSWSNAVQDPSEGGATNIIGYNVFRSTNGIDFTMINTGIVTSNSFDDPVPITQGYFYTIGLVYRGAPPVASAVISANSINTFAIDSDSDGIPDWWMLKYFGHPTGQASDNSLASDDADGTRMSNLDKFLAGLNPTNPASVFRINSITSVGTNVVINWQSGGGRSYVLQVATNVTGPYLNVVSNIYLPWSGDVFTNLIIPCANQPSLFYRIMLPTALTGYSPATIVDAQAVQSYGNSSTATSLTLATGGQLYIFGAATGGAYSMSAFANGQTIQLQNANGNISTELATSTNNGNSYSSSTSYHVIGGIGISGFNSVVGFYGTNPGPGQNLQASVQFTLSAPALVVVIGLGSSQGSLAFSGLDNPIVDVPPPSTDSGTEDLSIEHEFLPAGNYTVQESTGPSPGSTSANEVDLIGAYIFSEQPNVATSTYPQIPLPAGF